jgi:UDP-glucose 4-epimerase
MTKCIIFGGNGFIGTHLAAKLARNGYQVHIFGTLKGNLININSGQDKIKFIKGDFFDERAVLNALNDVDCVFHFISTTTPATAFIDPISDIQSNIVGSVKLFQACIKKNVDKIIFSSSGGTIYGNSLNVPVKETDPCDPVNPYAIGKITIEKYLYYFNYLYGIDYKILRYSNPYGERQSPHREQGVIPIFLNKIKNGEHPIVYGDGSSIRDYIYIKDAIDATFEIFKRKTKYNVFNVGSGVGTSILQLVDEMHQVTGRNIYPEFRESSPTYIPRIILDISRIKQETAWKPTIDLREGIKRTWEWINTNHTAHSAASCSGTGIKLND